MFPGVSDPPTDRGVSSVLGYILVFAVVIGGLTTVAALGGTALMDTQSQSELQRAEHSMTLFDSRTAMVALGASDTQTLRMGQDSGQFEVRGDSGYIALRHSNFTGTDDELLYNESLGAVVYENDGTEMAYQGGGVWRLDEDGSARLVSPPEFHYRRATLTLPVIRVVGDSTGTGTPTAEIKSRSQAELVFPNSTGPTPGTNETGAPYNGTDKGYLNPVTNGTVKATVKSRYYEGWAQYFRERTSGEVSVDHSRQITNITLVSLGGSIGRFPIPSDDGPGQDVRAVSNDGHPLKNFNVTLEPGGTFNGESHWMMYTIDDGVEWEAHIQFKPGGGCRDARIQMYYYNSSTGVQEEWETSYLAPNGTDAYRCVGSADELRFNFTSRTVDFEYTDVDPTSSSGKYCFESRIGGNAPDSPTTLDQHPPDPGSITTGHTETMNFTTSHYVGRLGPDFDLLVEEGQGTGGNSDCDGSGSGNTNTFDESGSVGVLEYSEAEGAQFITYLHVTENEVEVDFE